MPHDPLPTTAASVALAGKREKWVVLADGEVMLTAYSEGRARQYASTLGPDWHAIWIEHTVKTQERIR